MVLHLVFYLVLAWLPLSGFCPLPLLLLTLHGCTLSGSSLRVYFCAGALWLRWRGICCVTWFSPMCRALPQGLQLAQLSQLQVTLGFSGHRVSVLLLPWWRWLGFSPSLLFLCFSCSACLQGLAGLCTLCQGAPVAVVSAWVEGAVTLLPFPYIRVGVLLAYGVSGVCGLRRRSRLPFVVRHPFPVSVCPSPFLGLGWLGHRFVALLMLGCAVLTP